MNSQFILIKFLQVPGISPRTFRVLFLTLVYGNGLPSDPGTIPSRGRREPTSYKDADLWSIFPNVCLWYNFIRDQKDSKNWKSIFWRIKRFFAKSSGFICIWISKVLHSSAYGSSGASFMFREMCFCLPELHLQWKCSTVTEGVL